MKQTFQFHPTPLECAEEFANWSDDEQARFFAHVEHLFAEWGVHDKNVQLLGIGKLLRAHWPEAARLLCELALYAEDMPR